MNDYLKVYKVKLKTLSPVYIGSGQSISKKEYIYDFKNKKVYIPNITKMYRYFISKGIVGDFEKYMLNDFRDFSGWLNEKRISKEDFIKFCDYSLDSGDAVFENKGKKEILCFIKDAYNMPYIPGTSLKGALRTAVLSGMIIKNNDKLKDNRANVYRGRIKRDYNEESKEIEKRILHKNPNKPDEIDRFTGLKVSDSKPIPLENLTLCQKKDLHISGNTNSLNILRECIKPNTEIEFTITIDTTLLNFTGKELLGAIRVFANSYNKNFRSSFDDAPSFTPNTLFLGGGAGYATKTFTYPLLGRDVKKVSEIIDSTLGGKMKKEHAHFKDERLGASPHTLKLTSFRGKRYEFGACEISFEEKV